MDDSVIILIPAYNEQNTITHIVNHCLQYTQRVLVVDDGSTDNTSAFVKNTRALLQTNTINQGKGAALFSGFQMAIKNHCCGVITLDADGQHDPNDLPQFLTLIEKNPDAVIIGARQLSTESAPRMRFYANKIADFFISYVARIKLYDTQSGFRYYPKPFLTRYMTRSNNVLRFAFEAEILMAAVRSGLSVHYVQIESRYPSDARASHYRAGKDTWQIAKTVVRLMFNKLQ